MCNHKPSFIKFCLSSRIYNQNIYKCKKCGKSITLDNKFQKYCGISEKIFLMVTLLFIFFVIFFKPYILYSVLILCGIILSQFICIYILYKKAHFSVVFDKVN